MIVLDLGWIWEQFHRNDFCPGFETWNGSRDPPETNLAWVSFLNIEQFGTIDHALCKRFCDISKPTYLHLNERYQFTLGVKMFSKSPDLRLMSYMITPFGGLAISNYYNYFKISQLLVGSKHSSWAFKFSHLFH